MNLIPSVIPETGDYFCTWAAQARVRPVERMTVMAQDLCRDCAEDITRAVSRSGCELTISGELINRLCTGSLRAGDDSAPGLVLKLI